MIPIVLLAVAGYLALIRPRTAGRADRRRGPARPGGNGSARVAPPRCMHQLPSVASVAAVGDHPGRGPAGGRASHPGADPILAQAINGSGAPLNLPAPGFRLTDQSGRPMTLASLRGKVVLLTFLDPVCTSDCPLIAQEFRAAGQMLGDTQHVELVAIDSTRSTAGELHAGVRPARGTGHGAELAVPDRHPRPA